VVRTPHPTDGRSSLIRLSPTLMTRAKHASAPLVADLEVLAGELRESERTLVHAFLTRAADITEVHADRARREEHGGGSAFTPVPSLWG
jgi:hypothetical protein